MATTTNYGWTTPDDTALVKDGASAIRTLGTSVDTTTKNLNPETTLGDIAYRSSTSNVNTRLGIGSTGQVLTVASGVPSWATASSGGITLISTTNMTSSGAGFTITSIPSTYKNLLMIIENYRPSSASSNYLDIRFNQDGTANRHKALSSWDTATAQTPDATYIQMFADANNTTTTFGNIQVVFPDYANTTTAKVFYASGTTNNETTATNFNISFRAGFYNQTSAISSFAFFPESGSITSGTLYLYGVK